MSLLLKGEMLFEPLHERFVQTLGVQADEEEGVRLRRGFFPDFAEGVLVHKGCNFTFNGFEFLLVPNQIGRASCRERV